MTLPALRMSMVSSTMKMPRPLPALLLAFILQHSCFILSSAAEPAPPAAETTLQSLLRDALFEEEANRDLTKAAAGYEALLSQWDHQRALAASALYRLAEVRRKQDRKDDAIKLYQRLLREFPDADPHARLSRENLTALGVKAPAPAAVAMSAVPADPEEEKELRRLMMLAENSPDKVHEPVEPLQKPNTSRSKVSALANAAERGWTKVAAYLLELGADPNNGLAGSPLYYAASNGHKTICELLLAKGAKISTAGGALGKAIANNYTAVAELLIAKGADINYDTAVHLDEANKKGYLLLTPLAIAISRDNKVWIDRLLELKTDVNAAPNGQQLCALHVAAWRGNRVVLQKLLDLGAKPDLPDEPHDHTAWEFRNPGTDGIGWRALHYAAADPGMVEALLKAGANPSIADSNGLTPLHIACMRGKLESVKLLVAAKADVNARGTVRVNPNAAPAHTLLTPLQAATITADAPLIELLLAAGADPNPSASDAQMNMTPLYRAVNAVVEDNSRGSAAIVALLKAKADPNATADYRPVTLAARIEDKTLRDTVLAMLLDAGANAEPAIQTAPASVRVPLLRSYRYPTLAVEPAIFLSLAHAGHTQAISTRSAPDEKPGSIPAVLLAWNDKGGFGNQNGEPPDWSTLRLWRKAADGKMAETVLTLKPGMEFPELQWGDILEFVSEKWEAPIEPLPTANAVPRPVQSNNPYFEAKLPPSIAAILRSGQRARITFKSDGFTKDLTLRGVLRTYDPVCNEAPLLPVFDLVILTGGNRPGVIHIERAAARGGGTVAWHNGNPNPGALPEDGDIITFTPDKPDPKNLRVSLRVTGQPGSWQAYGPSQSVSLLQFLSEYYRALSPQLLLHDDEEDPARRAEKIKALSPDELLANLITSTAKPSAWPYLPWPDWSGVKVRRVKLSDKEIVPGDPFAETNTVTDVTLGEPESFDLLAAMNALTADSLPEDARKFDTILNPGDEVELPLLKDHPAGPWPGLDEAARRLFIKALTAKITLSDPDGRFHQATLQWLPPRWFPTAAGVLPIPDGDATGGRVHWIRALPFVKSVSPNMEPNSVTREDKFVVDPKQESSGDIFLRPGDRIMLRPAARPNSNQYQPPAPFIPQQQAAPPPIPINPAPASSTPNQPRRRVTLPTPQ
jgi:ankyrin repeat protein